MNSLFIRLSSTTPVGADGVRPHAARIARHPSRVLAPTNRYPIMKYLLLLMFTLVTLATPSGRMTAHRATISFEIKNQQAHSCGEIKISCNEGDTYVSVLQEQTYDTDIPSQALSITINGQTIPQGVK